MQMTDPIVRVLQSKTPAVWSVPPTSSVYEAIEKMSAKGVGALMVIEGDRLVGVISERDYTRKVILRGRSSRETRVDEIMTSSVVFVSTEKSVEDCMRLMTANRIRHLPVVDGARVAGVVSIGDLVKWIISAQEHVIHQMEAYITLQYPA